LRWEWEAGRVRRNRLRWQRACLVKAGQQVESTKVRFTVDAFVDVLFGGLREALSRSVPCGVSFYSLRSIQRAPCINEETPMTMQIGMLGTDGIVLASDTRCTTSPLNPGYGATHSYGRSKIRIDHHARIAVTCARDMLNADLVAEGIISNLKAGDWQIRERRIKEIGNEVASSFDTECLIAFADPKPALFKYATNAQGAVCERIIDFVHAGNTVNAAVFWSMRYYRLLPMAQLVRLAAHLVVVAGELNTAMIKGLEIVLCDSSGCHRLSDEENRELESKARGWDESIGKLICGAYAVVA
jgi:hypothetical protein